MKNLIFLFSINTMAGIVYLYVINASGIIGAVYGCYRGLNLVDNTCPKPEEHLHDRDLDKAAISSAVGCIVGGVYGLGIGCLSPFLATSLLVGFIKKNLI